MSSLSPRNLVKSFQISAVLDAARVCTFTFFAIDRLLFLHVVDQHPRGGVPPELHPCGHGGPYGRDEPRAARGAPYQRAHDAALRGDSHNQLGRSQRKRVLVCHPRHGTTPRSCICTSPVCKNGPLRFAKTVISSVCMYAQLVVVALQLVC